MRKNTNSDNITITEIFSGIKAKMRYFGKHCLDANGDVMPFNEQMAIVSHYLHNEKFASEKTYKEKALGLIEDIYEMKTGKENNILYTRSKSEKILFAFVFVLFTIYAVTLLFPFYYLFLNSEVL